MNDNVIQAFKKLGDAITKAGGIEIETTDSPLVKCTRCRNKHKESERLWIPNKPLTSINIRSQQSICPRCRCTSFYRLNP